MVMENKGPIHISHHLTGKERLTDAEAVIGGDRTQIAIARQCPCRHTRCRSEGSIIESNSSITARYGL